MMIYPLSIHYQSDNFPVGSVANGSDELRVTWDDILWAAVTVGRPNRHYVFRHGEASRYEAIFRWSMIRMALEQSNYRSYRLCRTNAAKTLDPSEKGAVNYFLGMSFCKLFAWKLLKTPWLLHLDVFRPMLDPVLKGKSRPDLVGKELYTNKWHAFECKGRISPPNVEVKSKAKDQAMRVVRVNGIPCNLHVRAITYFQDIVLQFYWCDPPIDERNQIVVPFHGNIWRHYFTPIVQILFDASRRDLFTGKEKNSFALPELDITVSIHPEIAKLLFRAEWNLAQQVAVDAAKDIAAAGYKPDGLLVQAGETWSERFKEIYSNKE